jgi:hypothetical protein
MVEIADNGNIFSTVTGCLRVLSRNRLLCQGYCNVIDCCINVSMVTLEIAVAMGAWYHNRSLYQREYSSVIDCCINRSIVT